jgi:hypothetical protein
VFRQGQILFTNVLLKGSFRFVASNFEDQEQEFSVYSRIYNQHTEQLVEAYEKILLLNLLNVEHGIESAEVEILEAVIQRNPQKMVKYKYKNLVSSKASVIDNALSLMDELTPIFNAFRFNEALVDGQPHKLQEGVMRVNCFDTGDITDLYCLFHFLMIFKAIFYNETLSTFDSFARGFMQSSTMNVMAIRGMFVNTFRRTNLLLNCKESSLSNCLSTEMPLEFLTLKENSNKIISRQL